MGASERANEVDAGGCGGSDTSAVNVLRDTGGRLRIFARGERLVDTLPAMAVWVVWLLRVWLMPNFAFPIYIWIHMQVRYII